MIIDKETNQILELLIKASEDLIENSYRFNTENAYNNFIFRALNKFNNNENLKLLIKQNIFKNQLTKNIYKYIEINVNNNRFTIIGKRIKSETDINSIGILLNRLRNGMGNAFVIFYSDEKKFKDILNMYNENFENLNMFSKRRIKVKVIEESDHNVYDIVINLLPIIKRNKKIEPIITNKLNTISTNKKISNIEISNFKLFKNIYIDFSPSVNVLLGKNGLGKTSFLQALALANIPDKNRDINSFEQFVSIDSKESTIILNREDEDFTTIQISELGKNTEGASNLHEPFIFAYGTNIFTNYEYPSSKFVDELFEGNNHEKWYYTDSIFKEKSENFYDPLRLLKDIENKEIDNKLLEFYYTTLNKLIPDYSIFRKGNLYYYKDLNNNLLKTEQLSEGYRNNILLLSDIIIRVLFIRKTFDFYNENLTLDAIFAKAKGIIAIDEFDRHLYPTWQKIYIDNLVKLLPEVQFFLTTHNPVSILGRNEGEVQIFVFDENQKNITIKSLPNTKNLDAGTVLISHFELDSILSIDLQTKLNKFYELNILENKSLETTTEIANLRKEIDNSTIGINIHDYRFYIFVKFLKDNGFDFRKRLEEITFTEEEILKLKQEFENYYTNLKLTL